MHFLLDNLLAAVIGGIALVLMIGVNQQNHRDTIRQQLLYQARSQMISLTDALTWDLNNTGYKVSGGAPSITRYTTDTVMGQEVTDDIEVHTRDVHGNALVTRYTLTLADTMTVDSGVLPLFVMRRYEDDVLVGETPPIIIRLDVDLLTATGAPAGPSNARQLRLNYRQAVAPGTDASALTGLNRELHWGITLTPPNLQTYGGS